MTDYSKFTRFMGTTGADAITGGIGFDLITGGTGDDNLNGSGGLNAATFSGNAAAYTITGFDSAQIVIAGADGTDTLHNIQFAVFADKVVPLYKPTPLFNFDEEYYLNSNPDVEAAVQTGQFASGWDHYQTHGEDEGRQAGPNNAFDAGYYASIYGDVAASNLTPAQHYELYGKTEGRSINLMFDPNYYLASNPDVAAAGVDPWTHFVFYGWKENRNPSPFFDLSEYAAHNSDVIQEGMNPLYHYLNWGQQEGRSTYIDASYFAIA